VDCFNTELIRHAGVINYASANNRVWCLERGSAIVHFATLTNSLTHSSQLWMHSCIIYRCIQLPMIKLGIVSSNFAARVISPADRIMNGWVLLVRSTRVIAAEGNSLMRGLHCIFVHYSSVCICRVAPFTDEKVCTKISSFVWILIPEWLLRAKFSCLNRWIRERA
jgi:hypothetical protein